MPRAKLYRVGVTEEDIREGVCGDCHRCAIARSLRRATNDAENEAVKSLVKKMRSAK